MTVGELEELLSRIENDDLEVYIHNSVNPCGNIGELKQVELTSYGFFGESVPCVVLNTSYTKEKLATVKDQYGDDVICEYSSTGN